MSLESLEPAPAPGPEVTPARRVLDDPVVLRAFAHPLRLRLHRLLLREGRCSAAYAARELGVSQALASHHLHQLAKYGFAEQVDGKDNRERPWQPLSVSTTWLGADSTDEGASAADLLEQTLVEHVVSGFLDWQQQRRDPAVALWHDAAGLDTSLLYLTPEETRQIGEAVGALLTPYLERSLSAERPTGLTPVEVTLLAVPLPLTSSGA
jgi:hypothetical protein